MAPVMKEADSRNVAYSLIHTGQHYSADLSGVFFNELGLKKPDHNLNVGSGTHAEETGRMLIAIEKTLMKERPDIVLVEGDTNSVLAGSLAATKLGIPVGHVEAGLRSRDRSMPEEINRILTDHMSDFLFAPTSSAKDNLMAEGIPSKQVWKTGNTIVDSLAQCMKIVKQMNELPDGVEKEEYLLLTLHRQENVDDARKLKRILEGLESVSGKIGMPVLWPVHPRSMKRIRQGHVKLGAEIRLLEPRNYFAFLHLLTNTRLVFTDSGGVQEEACILRVPCVTLRDNTERPETLQVGSNAIAGSDPNKIMMETLKMLERRRHWPNPFGDGQAGKRILDIILRGEGRFG